MKEKEKALIQSLLNNNRDVYRLYDSYKKEFLWFAFRYYQIDGEDAEEIFQESFIKLYDKLRNREYEDGDFSLKTYLFGIGKNYIYKYLERKGRNEKMVQNLSFEWLIEQSGTKEWHKAQEVAQALVHESDDDCNTILKLYYWQRMKMAEIAQIMNYKTEQVAKNKKSSCLRRMAFELRRRLAVIDIHWK